MDNVEEKLTTDIWSFLGGARMRFSTGLDLSGGWDKRGCDDHWLY